MTASTARTTPACQGRQALAAAQAHTAANDAAGRIHDDILSALATFPDTFLDALGGDFLAEADERRLRDKYHHQPVRLNTLLLKHRRTLTAQRALHTLYGKLQAGAAMTLEEKALAEHARDLCDDYAQAEADRRNRAGL
jgi:hypothetical protein